MEWVTEVHEHFSLFSFFFNEKEKKNRRVMSHGFQEMDLVQDYTE